jgi:hypothetical protein
MKERVLFIAIVITLNAGRIFAQCPTVAEFQAGGTFSPAGPCSLVAGTVTIPIGVTVNWSGGTLNIVSGGSGHLVVNGTFNLLSGNVFGNDGGSGQLTVAGLMTIADGSSYTSSSIITVNGTLNIAGSLTSDNSRIIVNIGAAVTIAGDGAITTLGTGDNQISGTLTLEDDATMTTSGDMEISGGTVSLHDNSDLAIGNDLLVYSGGSIIIDANCAVTVAELVTNSDDPPPITSPGTFTVNGSMTAGDVTIYDTDPESGLYGMGTLIVVDDFSDAECADYVDGLYAFCHCVGLNIGGAPCIGALPITLTSFSAEQSGNVILLKWTTETEINNHIFTIERLTKEDSFEPVIEIPGSGTALIPHNYQAFDAFPEEGRNYYRLKQTDFDGTSTTSQVIVAEFERHEVHVGVYPNPTRDYKFRIDVNGLEPEKEIKITLKTLQGVEILSFRRKADLSGSIHSEVEAPAKGFYLLDIAGKPIKIIVE